MIKIIRLEFVEGHSVDVPGTFFYFEGDNFHVDNDGWSVLIAPRANILWAAVVGENGPVKDRFKKKRMTK